MAGVYSKQLSEGMEDWCVFSLGIHFLDVSRENPCLHVCTARSEEYIVGMPVNRQDSGADGLLEQLADPPVVLGVEGADSDGACTAGDSEFVFVGAPADVGRGAIDAQQDERRLPDNLARLGVGGFLPNVGVPVLRRGNDAIGVGRPVNRCNHFVVLQDGIEQ